MLPRCRATEGRYCTSYTGAGVRANNAEKRAQAQAMRAQGQTFRAIAAELGVKSHNTIALVTIINHNLTTIIHS